MLHIYPKHVCDQIIKQAHGLLRKSPGNGARTVQKQHVSRGYLVCARKGHEKINCAFGAPCLPHTQAKTDFPGDLHHQFSLGSGSALESAQVFN